MAEWFFARNGQQQGPIVDDALRQLIARGEVTRDDTVWREGMTDWLPAGRLPELAPLFPAEMPQTVAYSQPFSDRGLPTFTDRAMQMLLKTRPWVRIVSILIFVAAGLMAIFGFIIMLFGLIGAGASGNSGGALAGGMAIFFGLIYLAIAALCFMPGLYLSRYASRISSLERMRREDQLEQALEAQKSFWKFVGIAILITIGLWLATVLLMVVGGIAGSSMSSGSRSPTFTPAPHVPTPPRGPSFP